MEKNELALQRPQKTGACSILENIESAKSDLRVRDEITERMNQTLKYVFALLGLRGDNLPDEGERIVLRDYFSQPAFNYSLLDLRNAFMLYVQGKLDYSESSFQTFSVIFLEKVLQSYRRYCNNLPQKPALQLTEKTPPSNEEVFKIMVQGAITCFEMYLKTGRLIDLGNVNYDFLSKEEHIKFTDELKWQFYNQAKEALKAEKLSGVMAGKETTPLQKLLTEIEGNHFDVVVKKAKKIALEEYFKSLIEMEMSLHEVLGIDVPAGIFFNSAEKKQQYQAPREQLVSQKTWLNWFDENFESFTVSELLELKKQLVNGSLHGANGAEICRISERLNQLEMEVSE